MQLEEFGFKNACIDGNLMCYDLELDKEMSCLDMNNYIKKNNLIPIEDFYEYAVDIFSSDKKLENTDATLFMNFRLAHFKDTTLGLKDKTDLDFTCKLHGLHNADFEKSEGFPYFYEHKVAEKNLFECNKYFSSYINNVLNKKVIDQYYSVNQYALCDAIIRIVNEEDEFQDIELNDNQLEQIRQDILKQVCVYDFNNGFKDLDFIQTSNFIQRVVDNTKKLIYKEYDFLHNDEYEEVISRWAEKLDKASSEELLKLNQGIYDTYKNDLSVIAILEKKQFCSCLGVTNKEEYEDLLAENLIDFNSELFVIHNSIRGFKMDDRNTIYEIVLLNYEICGDQRDFMEQQFFSDFIEEKQSSKKSVHR